MSDRDALLAAITAEPDEDTPRLVYADWLQDNGEADRAEFIRVQCGLEHATPRTPEAKQLASRAKGLRTKLFGRLDALGFAKLTFRRGFVGTITADLEHFRDHASALRPEDAPAFEWVVGSDEDREEFYADDAATREAFARPELGRCVSLDLPCLGLSPSDEVFRSERLVNLRRLNFPANEAGPAVQGVASPAFANLRWVNFRNSDSAADCPSIVPLAECPHLANLEYLDFGENEQEDEGAEAVAGAEQWNRLRYLNLSVSSFTLNGINALFHTDHLPALEELDLSHTFNSFGNTQEAGEYVADIIDSPLFTRLSKLWLRGNNITDDEANALAAAPGDVRLTLLDLRDNVIGAAGKRVLRKRFGKGVCLFGRADND